MSKGTELGETLQITESDNWREMVYAVEGEKFIFIQEYVKTRDAAKAYVRMKGLDEKPSNRHKKLGWELIQNDIILKNIIKSLMSDTAETLEITYQGHLKKLAEIRDAAMEAEKYAVALNAEVARGRAAGIYDEERDSGERDLVDLSSKEIEQRLKVLEDQKRKLPKPKESQPEAVDADFEEIETE